MKSRMKQTDAQIDFVVTWVDGADPAWRAEKAEWLAKANPEAATDWLTGDKRYRDWGLLRYWFRGVDECAPWVHMVHFVTWGHLPEWLDTTNPKLHIVNHRDYIPEEYLPTFNSHTIELNMHRIPNLTEQFVYFNDDMYLLKPVQEEDFFRDGLPRDFAGLDTCTLDRTITDYRPFNALVINEHFDKNEVIGTNRRLWLNPVYGPKCLIKTLLLLPFRRFNTMQIDHLPASYLKRSFQEVWNEAPDLMNESCKQKFRGSCAVSPWLIRDWQRAKGEFVPKRPEFKGFLNCGSGSGTVDINHVRKCINHPKNLRMICINDFCDTEDEFEQWAGAVEEAFSKRFPRKSSFEV